MSTPAVTPSAKAKAAYPIGTMPCAPNASGAIRGKLSVTAWSRGTAHQSTARTASPEAAIAASPTRPSLTASQRLREMLWFHTSRCVPLSSSRAMSGAPQKIPMRAGRTVTIAIMAPYSTWWSVKNRLAKWVQASSEPHDASPLP
ncbi:hypothetical protein [Actinomadura sp. NAK00032]|uniref:hypothetical protein n=1 Tax=Actinomadura sp. NAK00032 TaxID=2742128 RepID=UPI0020C81CFC|nr:hypothetical protein [Actinomadura sp. NAK00032]